SEKRPFFIEGSNIYNFQIAPAITGGSFTSDNLFYSRRIGRQPHGRPALIDNEYADLPDNATIWGAGKLSGKTTGGLSIGIMEAVTAEERAEISGVGGKRKESVEPLTNYFVGRLEQDLREGATTFGAMLTATHRDISNHELFYLHDAAYGGGLDLTHKWNDRSYYISATALFSRVSGDESAVYYDQVSSARYYQRPDADYVSLDTTRTSLAGHAGSIRLGKRSQEHFRFETGAAWRSPGFEINDLGYMRSADEFNQFTWIGYHFNDPFSIFRRLSFNGNQWTNFDFGGSNTSNSFNVNSSMTFKSNWSAYAGLTWTPDYISNTALRGGPSSKWPGELSYSFNVSSDSRRRIDSALGANGDRGGDDYYSRHQVWADLNIRPTDAVSIGISPSMTKIDNELQYIDLASFNGDSRYIFGKMIRKTAAMTLRIDYCLTPSLTIQFYGQPFISTGEFSDLKRITDPRADKYTDRYHTFIDGVEITRSNGGNFSVDEDQDSRTDYTLGNPDFSFKEFNSNLVLRWEFRPGSTLYLVWNQGRSTSDSNGDFSLGGDTKDLFNVHPRNIFLFKISRWFSL
ncbi:MAG: hypothetical protein KJ927_00005, partial [Candidatus Eisenbacteria bacterium]|nr:hypothetical protein [Candidatus Eisenbacteria bacterium]